MDFNHTFFKKDVYDLFKDNFDSQNEDTKPTIQKSTILDLEKIILLKENGKKILMILNVILLLSVIYLLILYSLIIVKVVIFMN